MCSSEQLEVEAATSSARDPSNPEMMGMPNAKEDKKSLVKMMVRVWRPSVWTAASRVAVQTQNCRSETVMHLVDSCAAEESRQSRTELGGRWTDAIDPSDL